MPERAHDGRDDDLDPDGDRSGASKYTGSHGETTMGSLSSDPTRVPAARVRIPERKLVETRDGLDHDLSLRVHLSQLCSPASRDGAGARHDEQDHRRDRERGRQRPALTAQAGGDRANVRRASATDFQGPPLMLASPETKEPERDRRGGHGKERQPPRERAAIAEVHGLGRALTTERRRRGSDGPSAVRSPVGIPVLVEDDVVATAGASTRTSTALASTRRRSRGAPSARSSPRYCASSSPMRHAGHPPSSSGA